MKMFLSLKLRRLFRDRQVHSLYALPVVQVEPRCNTVHYTGIYNLKGEKNNQLAVTALFSLPTYAAIYPAKSPNCTLFVG